MDTKRISAQDSPPKSEDSSASVQASLRQPLVLIVDDTVDNAAVVSLDLQHRGYRAITAASGEEAIKIAAMMRPDIILMDIGMPQMDGIETTRHIRADATLRQIPIVAITAFNTDVFRRAAYEVGFDGYLTKPLELERLHQLMQKLLATRNEDAARAPDAPLT